VKTVYLGSDRREREREREREASIHPSTFRPNLNPQQSYLASPANALDSTVTRAGSSVVPSASWICAHESLCVYMYVCVHVLCQYPRACALVPVSQLALVPISSCLYRSLHRAYIQVPVSQLASCLHPGACIPACTRAYIQVPVSQLALVPISRCLYPSLRCQVDRVVCSIAVQVCERLATRFIVIAISTITIHCESAWVTWCRYRASQCCGEASGPSKPTGTCRV
jgi:hypothetical protein